MNIRKVFVWASMMAMTACMQGESMRKVEVSGPTSLEKEVLNIKELYQWRAISVLWWSETEEWKEWSRSCMEYKFKEKRCYFVRWWNVVYNDHNSCVIGNWCEVDEREKLFPIKDDSTFRELTKSNKFNWNPTECAIFDGKFYFMWKHFPEIDAQTAVIFDENHILDKNWVYFYYSTSPLYEWVKTIDWKRYTDIPVIKKLENAMSKDFRNANASEVLSGMIRYTEIPKYQADALESITREFKTDWKNVYCSWKKLNVDASKFVVVARWYGHDGNTLYFYGEKISWFDLSKLKILNPDGAPYRSPYIMDDKMVIFWWDILKWADPANFKITVFSDNNNDLFSTDWVRQYVWSKLTNGYEPRYEEKRNQYKNLNDLF